MIQISDVGQTFITDGGDRVVALDDVTLTVGDGEIVTLVGPSGCGKSTLLNIIAGFQEPTGGTVTSDGEVITGPGVDRGVVFQSPPLLPWLSAAGNVPLAGKYDVGKGVGTSRMKVRIDDAINAVGLSHAVDRLSHELSGGMRQRTQFARVLAADPATVLMDEPFGALDPFTREQLQAEVIGVWHRSRPTIIFVTHSVEEALLIGHRVVVMATGPGRIIRDIEVPARLRSTGYGSGHSREQLQGKLRAAAADPELVKLRRELTEAVAAAHVAA